jgi:hypothetical protein
LTANKYNAFSWGDETSLLANPELVVRLTYFGKSKGLGMKNKQVSRKLLTGVVSFSVWRPIWVNRTVGLFRSAQEDRKLATSVVVLV